MFAFYAPQKTRSKKLYEEYLKNEKTPIERVQTVDQWAEQWLETYKKDKVSYKTYYGYELFVTKHIDPALRSLRLKDVRPVHIEQFYMPAVIGKRKG